jgi:ABC-2 type transport system permease protein
MNRTLKAILAVVFVGIIMFSGIVICQNLAKGARLDVTDQKIYTLSDGTKAIIQNLKQPIEMKLYYSKTAALKGPDQIKYFNNYYYFVEALLREYSRVAGDMINLQIIDPRPYSDEESDAIRYNLKRFPITEEEFFVFGLVVQTQFGVTKTIEFFSPDRQNFVEYDISYLIDTAIRREKKRVGVISSLPVMGDDVTGYMAQMMRMQGQQPTPPWGIVEHIKQQYDITAIDPEVTDINNVDILLVLHPKDLPEKTLFAIDQFVIKGGPTVVCVDPHCIADHEESEMQMPGQLSGASSLNFLMKNWGLEMPGGTFAGDPNLAVSGQAAQGQRPQPILPIVDLVSQKDCFSGDSAVTANLNEMRMAFAGVLDEVDVPEDVEIDRVPLISTTDTGNSWKIDSPYELMIPDPASWMRKFVRGTRPVHMAYEVTGKFKTAFPDGITIRDESDPNSQPEQITAVPQAETKAAVVVISDVDFLTDRMAYQRTPFGLIPIGDNGALVLNMLDDISGSSNLISIRSRGNFQRPFTLVDDIEKKAEEQTAAEVAELNAAQESIETELNELLSNSGEGQKVIGSSIVRQINELEQKKRQTEVKLNEVQLRRREATETLKSKILNLCTLPGPIAALFIAGGLGIYRASRRRYYVSHAVED